MNSTPPLSVVVPTHGRVDLFQETLASIQSQTLANFELIVSDDSGDIDDQHRIAVLVDRYREQTGRITKYVFTKPRLGQSGNTNQGLAAATGDVIRLLHSDDLLRDGGLQWELDRFQSLGNLEILFQDCIPFHDPAQIQWRNDPAFRLIDPQDYFRQFLSISTALPSGLLFTKACLDRVGGMRTDWSFLCDWELFARLLLDAISRRRFVGYARAGNYAWRLHEDSTTTVKWKDHFTEHAALMAQWQSELPTTPGQLFIDDRDRSNFFQIGHEYRYRRLTEDCVGLSSDRFAAAKTLLRDQSEHAEHDLLRRKAKRRVYRRRLLNRFKRNNDGDTFVPPTGEPVKADAERSGSPTNDPKSLQFVAETPWKADYVITGFLDDPLVQPGQTSVVVPMDNGMNLWPIRDQLLAADRIGMTNVNLNRFYERTLDEALKYVRCGSEIEFTFHDNHRMTWFGFKTTLSKIAPGQFTLVYQSQSPKEGNDKGHSWWTLRYRRVADPPAWTYEPMTGLTIGVLTLGDRVDELNNLIATARRYATLPIEFVVVAPREIDFLQGQENLRQIQFDQRDDFGWITRKKNLICEAANHSDIVVCHDRFEFTELFFRTFQTWGHSYGIAAPRLVLPDGRRALDWAVVRGENQTWCQGGLLSYRDYSRFSYVPGGVTMIRKSFWRAFPWSEDLYWNEHEDVELCRRIQRVGARIDLFPGPMIATRDRWVDANPMLPYSSEWDVTPA